VGSVGFSRSGTSWFAADISLSFITLKATPPDWLEYLGETRPLRDLPNAKHQILLCNNPALISEFDGARADLKMFYFVLEKIQDEKAIATSSNWVPLANSTGIYRRLVRRYGVHAKKVFGGINLEVFHPGDSSSEGGRTSLDSAAMTAEKAFRIVSYGRVSRRTKGVPLTLSAVSSFRKNLQSNKVGGKGLDLELHLFDHVGPGNERDPRELVKTSIPHRYHINQTQEQLADLYRTCDLFVSAERRAGWSNTVAEAMACGVPVVCTRSGTQDIAISGETAWVVPLRHPWFLRRGIQGLYQDSERRESYRKAALKRIQDFSWPRVVDQLEAVVHKAVGKAI